MMMVTGMVRNEILAVTAEVVIRNSQSGGNDKRIKRKMRGGTNCLLPYLPKTRVGRMTWGGKSCWSSQCQVLVTLQHVISTCLSRQVSVTNLSLFFVCVCVVSLCQVNQC